MQSADSIVLDLGAIATESKLSREVATSLAQAASVVLDRLHGARDGDEAEIHCNGTVRAAKLKRVEVHERARESFGDPDEATEKGAEGVAVTVAARVLNRVVFRRLPKHTGADYLMCHPEAHRAEEYERLECSGIGEGRETARNRLRAKITQLARFPHAGPGTAVVTHFRDIELHIESWAP
jgi:hypothetical protein